MSVRLIFMFLLTLLLTAEQPQACAEAHQESQYRIGVIAPLSGELAEFGSAIQNGITLAQERADRPVRIEFVFEDDRYEGARSVAAFQKLVDIDQSDLVMAFGSVAGHVLAPIAEARKVPLLILGFEEEFAVRKDFVFRSMNFSRQYSGALLAHLRRTGVDEMAILETELSFIQSMTDPLKEGIRQGGERLVFQTSVLPTERDFRSLALKIRRSGVKHLGVFLLPSQIDQLLNQLARLNVEVSLFGVDHFETVLRLSNSEERLNGATYPDNNASVYFYERYEKRFGNTVQLTFAANAFDMATLIADTVESIEGKPAGLALMEAFHFQGERWGALGPYRALRSPARVPYFKYDVVVKEIRNGKSQPVG